MAPATLPETLSGLVSAGALDGFEIRGDDVWIWGDLRALELALAQGQPAPLHTEHVDRRAEYYRACAAYMHTESYRSLPEKNRAIWRLHAQGASHAQIAQRLHLTLMQVRVAVKGARLAAQLPGVTSVMPRGTASTQGPCSQAGCANQSRARGMCMAHYLRWRRRGG